MERLQQEEAMILEDMVEEGMVAAVAEVAGTAGAGETGGAGAEEEAETGAEGVSTRMVVKRWSVDAAFRALHFMFFSESFLYEQPATLFLKHVSVAPPYKLCQKNRFLGTCSAFRFICEVSAFLCQERDVQTLFENRRELLS